MTEQMNPGDAVLVRATYDDYQDDGPQVWVTLATRENCSPCGDTLVLRSQLTTEAAIRADERARVEAEHDRTTNDDLQDAMHERIIRADERRRVAADDLARAVAEAAAELFDFERIHHETEEQNGSSVPYVRREMRLRAALKAWRAARTETEREGGAW